MNAIQATTAKMEQPFLDRKSNVLSYMFCMIGVCVIPIDPIGASMVGRL